MKRTMRLLLGILLVFPLSTASSAQQAGGVRGVVYDRDFESVVPGAQVLIPETGQKAEASEEGFFLFGELPPGTYTIIVSKEGYIRQVRGDLVVTPGALTELEIQLAGDYTELEEFIVQDIAFGGGTEAGLFEIPLLELRLESAAFLDSIGADLMSQAGASDAADGLKLVAGASVQDGKYAVIRGLPDRYVNSQLNGVRLPTADADKRAVQLDQFPSAVIDSIQVSKTFTPDQQGDASGGAVNIVLKGIPDEPIFKLSGQFGENTQVTVDDFLSYEGGGVSYWGRDQRDIQAENLGGNWDGPVGVSPTDGPRDYKWSLDAGTQHELDSGARIGGFASFFYERDSSYFENGIDDKYWVERPGAPMTPQFSQGSPSQGDFKTSLFDVTEGAEEVKWGGLSVLGIENEDHALTFTSMYTRTAEDSATLAEDTRGKHYYFPEYDPNDPFDPGNLERDAAPYLRTETLEYTERTTKTFQLSGRHRLGEDYYQGRSIRMLAPELDWGVSHSSAGLYQPDKRQFGSLWWGESYSPGFPPFVPPSFNPAVHRPYKPAANFTVGNLQRIWKEIDETSDQQYLNLKLPFEQWSGDKGYLKFGLFNDAVEREYQQDSFSNFNDNSASYFGPYEDFWSASFPGENHPITAAEIDVDYMGEQNISAWYSMIELPLNSKFKLIGGARFEKTELGIVNFPEKDVTWIPPGSSGQVALRPGDADVSFEQNDVLPSIGFVFSPDEKSTLRGSYTQTVARQTFKELTPIQQQEFLGGDVFIGNPFLQMSALKNYDLRYDYTPAEGSFFSLSYFYKDIENPIEYVQRIADFAYTTPVNYPEGVLSGWEMEARQDVGKLAPRFAGLSLGANATFIDSEVTLPDDEAAAFDQPNIQAPTSKRAMTGTPEHLYNLFLTYDLENLGWEDATLAFFYTVTGDTLIAGAGQSKGFYVPDVYAKEYGTLNMSLTKKINEKWSWKFQAKNLTNPKIETTYRSDYIDEDVTKTSFQRGMEFSLSLTGVF